MNTMQYKGFTGSVEVDFEDSVLFGKVLLINDLVNYEGQTPAELKAGFESAIDDYIEQCKANGKQPDKSLSGAFNVRVGPELHRLAYLRATQEGIALNSVVVKALQVHLQPVDIVTRGRRASDHGAVFVTGVATAAAQPLKYETVESLHVSATAH